MNRAVFDKARLAGIEAAKRGEISSGNPYDPHSAKQSAKHQAWEAGFTSGWTEQVRSMESKAT